MIYLMTVAALPERGIAALMVKYGENLHRRKEYENYETENICIGNDRCWVV
ncbi:MAG: hypothetical protein LIP11_15370 [Clostridiales bacterium]|nr:hypothetical protein [Clostridiales bacterium]